MESFESQTGSIAFFQPLKMTPVYYRKRKKFLTSTNFDLQSVSCGKLIFVHVFISPNVRSCNKMCAIFKDMCTLVFQLFKGRSKRTKISTFTVL